MMVLDTGMGGVDCVVAHSLAASVPSAPGADGRMIGEGGGGTVPGTALRLARLCLGDYCRRDVRAVVLRPFALRAPGLGFRVAGLLASDFFRGGGVDARFRADADGGGVSSGGECRFFTAKRCVAISDRRSARLANSQPLTANR
ncbi:MAG: hypothetical protein MZV65_34640 [Chromatiales bacterium]|nr:hypothetical protein [Chromatiales bacterium]